MRPGQNKRLRGRSGRKGPNPLTRSFESNGPDVKIRGTAQHVAEKYLQLARDAQSSGDIVLAENLLQHAEHYFRLISAAQQAQATNGFGRQSYEAELDEDDDDDFAGVPDRFAPLSERLPPPAYQQQQQPFASAPAAQPLFAPQPPPPQPFEERPAYPDQPRPEQPPRHERQARQQRPPFRERSMERSLVDRGEQGGEGSEGGRQFGFNRNRDRDRPRFQPRREPMGEPSSASDAISPGGLPAFITAPTPRPAAAPTTAPVEASEPIMAEDRESSVFHNRRRRRLRPQLGEPGGQDETPVGGELPLGE
ncbi:MAG TPA: DUF4167 domain-containing protein [Methylocystis sp.]|nr:DUF4167 domain-containing protein [Methylocystis sp.]